MCIFTLHLVEQLKEWEESPACHKVLGWSLFPWKVVKTTSSGRQRFPISHENSITVPVAWLSCRLPPIQTELMTHDPGMEPLKAGLRLILGPHYLQLLCHRFCFLLSHTQTVQFFRTQNTGPHLSKGCYYSNTVVRVIYCI